jgi:hypothetical protein
MSYDIVFLQKSTDQTWEEALEANEIRALTKEPRNAPASEAVYSEWNRIADLLLECNPGMSKFESINSLEMTDENTGLQVSLYASEADISVPYQHAGDTAQEIMALARKLALILEKETGLVGYDGQLGRRFLDTPRMSQEAGALLSSMSRKIHEEDLQQLSKRETRRPWWMFWKR